LSSKGYTYPVEACYVKTRSVSKGDQNVDWVPFIGTLPKRIFFWQITHEAYNGKIESNIFNFQSFRINKFQVFRNGLSLPIDAGFTNIQDNNYKDLYQFSARGVNSKETFPITITEFQAGYLLACIDLTQNGNANQVEENTESGSLRLTIDYQVPLAGSVTLFCLGEFNETLRIDKHRQIAIHET